MRHRPTSRGFCTLVVLALAFWPLMDVWHERNTDSFLDNLKKDGELSRLKFANDVKDRIIMADREADERSLAKKWVITAGADWQKEMLASGERMDGMRYGR